MVKENNDNFDDTDKERFKLLEEDEGDGSYCCGKSMVLAKSGIAYECLNCGSWEYSDS